MDVKLLDRMAALWRAAERVLGEDARYGYFGTHGDVLALSLRDDTGVTVIGVQEMGDGHGNTVPALSAIWYPTKDGVKSNRPQKVVGPIRADSGDPESAVKKTLMELRLTRRVMW
jgi:hypothetical protein